MVGASSVQLLSHVRFFATPWTAAHQASLSTTNSWSLPKLMSIESVMPSNHLILPPPSPPALNLSQHQGLFQRVNSSHQVATLHMKYWSFSFSIIPSKEHPGLISFQSKGLSRVFSNTTVQKHQFFSSQLSL